MRDGPSAFISLKRNKSSMNQLRQFTVSIDDSTVGKIKPDQTKLFKLPCGSHSIRVKLDLYKSRQLLVDLKPDQTVMLECGDNAPENLKEVFSLKGVEKSLSSLVNPSQFLYLKPTGAPLAMHSAGSDATPQLDTPAMKAQKRKRSCTLFISYRREDSREITGRIFDRLSGEFGKETVFRDVDSIPAGVDFREHIGNTIDRCSVLVAIIGNQWLAAKNSKGERRLELANDPLRVEIETALKKGVPVIPVLVKNASMPDEDDLPEGIKALAFRNAITIPGDPYFHNGVDRLIDELNKCVSPKEEAAQTASRHFCIHCGSEIAAGNRFCTQCGNPI